MIRKTKQPFSDVNISGPYWHQIHKDWYFANKHMHSEIKDQKLVELIGHLRDQIRISTDVQYEMPRLNRRPLPFGQSMFFTNQLCISIFFIKQWLNCVIKCIMYIVVYFKKKKKIVYVLQVLYRTI